LNTSSRSTRSSPRRLPLQRRSRARPSHDADTVSSPRCPRNFQIDREIGRIRKTNMLAKSQTYIRLIHSCSF
jgi:hypothetical protein